MMVIYSTNNSIWIKNNIKYKKKNWIITISKRILAWILNADIILNNADKILNKFFLIQLLFKLII